jgi:hypothetical protein
LINIKQVKVTQDQYNYIELLTIAYMSAVEEFEGVALDYALKEIDAKFNLLFKVVKEEG